jgi:hypothetical protein
MSGLFGDPGTFAGAYGDAGDADGGFDFADDVDVMEDAGDDPRAAYVAWTAAVKRYGGHVATMPHVNAGAPAAAYPVEVIYPPPGYTLNPIFHRPPDDWSGDSGTGYYRAPAIVIQYAMTGMKQPQRVPGETPPPKPDWYEQLLTIARVAPWIIGGVLALNLVSALPRGRR